MKDQKKTEGPKQEKARELDLEDLEKVSGGGDNPFKDVPRVSTNDYDKTIKSKV